MVYENRLLFSLLILGNRASLELELMLLSHMHFQMPSLKAFVRTFRTGVRTLTGMPTDVALHVLGQLGRVGANVAGEISFVAVGGSCVRF